MHLRLVSLVVATVATLSLGACGNKESVRTTAESESIYLDLDSLKYQVQVSRELNPADPEDRYYLAGLSRSDQDLEPDEVFFGVFLQVENDTDQPHPTAHELEIEDTEHNAYRPIRLAPINAFAYRSTTLGARGRIPAPDTPAFAGPTQGALVLFKLKEPSLDNRPLELSITSRLTPDEAVRVDLDV